MNWKSCLLALGAAVGLASAQSSTAYTDPGTGIAYQSFSTVAAGGYIFGIALPTSPTDDFIGHIVGPISGWSGVSLGGSMTDSLLFVAWENGNEIVHSFRWVDSHVDPLIYDGPTATTMYSSVNATHFEYTFHCQNCMTWDSGSGWDPTADSTVFGWAISLGTLADPSNPDTVLPYHSNGKGRYGMNLAGAKSSLYQSWLDAAGVGGPVTTAAPTSTAAPTPTTTAVPIPSSATILGEYDYIVVGSGAGGLVAADRLSESGATVLLIERGPPSTGEHGGTIAPEWSKAENLTRFDIPGLCNEIWVNSSGIACEDVDRMAGCVLGGGTAVNAGMFFVPPTRDWDYNFPTGWKASDIAAAQARMIARIPSNDTPSMDGKRYIQEVYTVLGAAVKKAGWTELANINSSPDQKLRAFGHSPFMFSNGERGGPLATYLRTAKKRANFKLVTDTMVRRVIRSGATATGVEVYATASNGKTGIYKVKATGRVVLSAGAFGTAKILFRSGIGPKDMLDIVKSSATDGASMIAKSQWILSPVGYNVLDHTNTDLVVSHPNIKAYDFYAAYDNPPQADKDAYLNHRAGILSNAAPGIPLVLYDQVVGTDGIPRQIQWTARAEGSLGEAGNTLITISQYLGTGVTSRGRIIIKSNLGMTVGTEPYGLAGADKAAIVTAVENMLTAIKGWTDANGTAITVLQPPAGMTAQAYVDAYVQGRGTNHWLGSARLGTDDGTKLGGTSGSVVDLNTKVYGTNNIHVVDASIFPGNVATNPSAPIIIAAEHAVKKILAIPLQNFPTTAATSATASSGGVARYGQCGGQRWTGATKCVAPYTCTYSNPFYSQCV